MQEIVMNYREVVEYTGLIHRPPTPDEIDIVLAWYSLNMFEQRQCKKGSPLNKINEEILKIQEDARPCMEATAFVMDYTLLGKRVMCYNDVDITYEDHSAIREHLAEMIESIKKQTGAKEVVVFGESEMQKATQPHNHLVMFFQYVEIDEANNCRSIRCGDINLCLKKYPKES